MGWKIVGTIDSDIKNAYDGYALIVGAWFYLGVFHKE
jgi:hypothetical protein